MNLAVVNLFWDVEGIHIVSCVGKALVRHSVFWMAKEEIYQKGLEVEWYEKTSLLRGDCPWIMIQDFIYIRGVTSRESTALWA
jgi:hypothetical protein